MQKTHPGLSSFINLSKAVRGQKFDKTSISIWFNKLVEKDDYLKSEKRALIANLILATNE